MKTQSGQVQTGRIPDGWHSLSFGDCIDKKRRTVKYRKVQRKAYLDAGRYPIVDQGQEFIAGYTNDEDDVYRGSVPLTIFGDHTLCVKFVDMEFAVGADGTVLLYPNKNRAIDKFFYYLISNHGLKSEGYQRHLKYLKQERFAVPPVPEQRKIAEILSTVDEAIEKTDAVIQETQQLKRGLMQKLFTEGIGHSSFKETKIGRIPEEWSTTTLRNVCHKETNRFEPREADAVYPYVGLEHMEAHTHQLNGYGQSNKTLSTKNIFRTNDILYGKLRPYLNKVWKAEFDGVCTTEIIVVSSGDMIEQDYLYYLLQRTHFVEYANSMTEGTSLPRVDWSDICGYGIALPPLPEQRRIAEILSGVDAKVETEQAFKAELEQLKKGLMQVLLTGKVRVQV